MVQPFKGNMNQGLTVYPLYSDSYESLSRRPIGNRSTSYKDPPMLTMCASDPDETGGSGCAVAGISRARRGSCFKYTWVREWKYPSTAELLYVQQRLLDFLIQYGLRQADMCEALGLVTTYMSLFLKDVHSSNLGSRRRAEMFCVLNEFFLLIDEGAFDMEALFRVRAQRRGNERFRLPEESFLPELPPDDPYSSILDQPIPNLPGISRRYSGRLFKYSSVKEWIVPTPQECADLRVRLVKFLDRVQLKPADLCDALGLVVPYLVHFINDPNHPLVGKRRRVELYNVVRTYFSQLDSGEQSIRHLHILRELRHRSENMVKNSRAPAPVYKRGSVQDRGTIPSAMDRMRQETERVNVWDNCHGTLQNKWLGTQAEPVKAAPQPANMYSLHVPPIHLADNSMQPAPYSQNGMTDEELQNFLCLGEPNELKMEQVAPFSQHLSKIYEGAAQGSVDTRNIPGSSGDWRCGDRYLYNHKDTRYKLAPNQWPSMDLLSELTPTWSRMPKPTLEAEWQVDKDCRSSSKRIKKGLDDDTSQQPISQPWEWEQICSTLSMHGLIDGTGNLISSINHVIDDDQHALEEYRQTFLQWKAAVEKAVEKHVAQRAQNPSNMVVRQQSVSRGISNDYDASYLSSAFLALHLWTGDLQQSRELWAPWVDLSFSLNAVKCQNTTNDVDETSTVASLQDWKFAYESTSQSRGRDLTPVIPICVPIIGPNSVMKSFPGNRECDSDFARPAHPPVHEAALSLYDPAIVAFLDSYRLSHTKGHYDPKISLLVQSICKSYTGPLREYTMIRLNEKPEVLDLIVETRLSKELGMADKEVHEAQKLCSQQFRTIKKLFRCFRVAKNALGVIAASGCITTKINANSRPPYDQKYLIDAVATVPVVIDILVEDEQIRVHELAIWDIYNVDFNTFVRERASAIISKSKLNKPTHREPYTRCGLLYSTFKLLQNQYEAPSTPDNSQYPVVKELPERLRNVIETGIANICLKSISEFCLNISTLFYIYRSLFVRKTSVELLQHAILSVPTTSFAYYMNGDRQKHECISRLPHTMGVAYVEIAANGKLSEYSPNLLNILCRILDVPPVQIYDPYEGSRYMINLFFNYLDSKPVEFFDQGAILKASSVPIHHVMPPSQRAPTQKSDVSGTPPESEPHQPSVRQPRRSSRVRTKQVGQSLSLKEKFHLLSSNEEEDSDDETSTGKHSVKSDDEWHEAESSDGESELEESSADDES